MNENNPFTTPHSMTPPLRKTGVRWWLIGSIFGVPVLLLMLGSFVFRIGFTIRENSGRKAMAAEIEKLESEGKTIGNESTDALYRSRTSAEDQERWLNLLSDLQSSEFRESTAGVPLLDGKIDDDKACAMAVSSGWVYADACSNLTEKYREAIAEIHVLAAATTPVQFPIYFQSTETLLPEVQGVRQVARIVFVDCLVAIHRKDTQRATQDIKTLCLLVKHVDAVPFVVSRLVGIATKRLALEALQTCMKVDLLNDHQLKQIDDLLESSCDIGNRWHSSMSEELGLNLAVFTNPSIAMKSKSKIPPRGHDAVYFIDLMRRAMALETSDWPEFYKSALKLESELDSSAKSRSVQTMDRILSHLLAPAFSAFATTLINDAQMHRQARLAILIRLHAHRNRELPAKLEELSSDAAQLCPVGSESFGYRLEKDRALLWGFEWSNEVRQTPNSPQAYAPGVPHSIPNESLVWIIDRASNGN